MATPLKEIRVKQNTEPWMSTEILNLIKERDELLLKYRKFNNSEDHKKFCIIRNKVQKEVKSARSNYFSDKIEENKNYPKKTVETVKRSGVQK
jgi:GTPase involved in cell partitioning and DNA repair